VAGVLALAGTLFAAQTGTAAQAEKPKATKAAKAPKAMTAMGAIKEAAADKLTITTKAGDETFAVGADTKIHEGAKAMTAADLSGLTGQNAKVTYTETGGTKTATAIVITKAKAPKAPKEPKK
jgi:hypothetical protein